MTNTQSLSSTLQLDHSPHQNQELLSEEEYQELIAEWKQGQRQSLKITHFDTQLLDTKEQQDDPKNQINLCQERQNTLKKHSKEIVQYLKAKYIVQDLIEPLERYNFMDLQKIKNVQFMYMISFRAWCEIQMCLQKFYIQIPQNLNTNIRQKNQILQKLQQNPNNLNDLQKSLVDSMVKLYLRIDKYVQNYHRILIKHQLFLKNRIRNIFRSIFNSKRKNQRNRFLFGYQGRQFMRKQQINYLYSFYVKNAINEIEGNCLVRQNLVNKIKIYKKILNVNICHLRGFDDFEILKQNIIDNLTKK